MALYIIRTRDTNALWEIAYGHNLILKHLKVYKEYSRGINSIGKTAHVVLTHNYMCADLLQKQLTITPKRDC